MVASSSNYCKIGDCLLQDTATSLQSYFDSATLVARVGGDEFAIAILDLSDVQAAIAIAAQMQLFLWDNGYSNKLVSR